MSYKGQALRGGVFQVIVLKPEVYNHLKARANAKPPQPKSKTGKDAPEFEREQVSPSAPTHASPTHPTHIHTPTLPRTHAPTHPHTHTRASQQGVRVCMCLVRHRGHVRLCLIGA